MKFRIAEFDKIILDMDGVITSEYIYWNSAALSVYELLYDYRFYGKQEIDRLWCRKNYPMLFDTIFCGGRTVRAVKDLGVNTNWDLAFLVFCVSKYLEPELLSFDVQHFEAVCMFIENMTLRAPDVYDAVGGLTAAVLGADPKSFRRGEGRFWQQLLTVFQRWFLGNKEAEGLQKMEQPLLELEQLKKKLSGWRGQGIRLGIGTGRPREEIFFPLDMWGLWDYFDPQMIASYDEVTRAEEDTGRGVSLAKPHPFIFQKAAFGETLSDREILDGKAYQLPCAKVLVVGDATSDLLAAKAGGFPFAAVLTGIQGETARASFVVDGADYIFESLLEMGEQNVDKDKGTIDA